jgi:hypothetical protein
MENMQSQLDTVIANNFERVLRGIGKKITDAISPYSRFVETERKKVEESKEKLKEIRLSTREIRKRIE